MCAEPVVDKAAQIAAYRSARDSAGLLPYLAAEENVGVRLLAVDALAAIGDPAALDALGGRMARPEPEVSEHVLDLLGARPGADTARLISRGLGARDPIWRNRVLEALAARSEPEVIGLIITACRDRSAAIRPVAMRHLRRLLNAHPDRAAELPPARLDDVLGLLDAAEIPPLFGAGPAPLRCAAARRLAALGGEESFRALAATAVAEAGDVGEAAFAAHESAPAASVELFRPLTAHGATAIRRRALVAVGERSGAAATGMLTAALDDPEAPVRETALRGLCAVMTPGLLTQVAARLRDAHPAVRVAAVEATARVPGDESVALLTPAIHDPDAAVRWRAILALAQRGIVDPAHAPTYVQLLADLATRPRLAPAEIDGLCAIAACLGGLGEVDARPALDALVLAGRASSARLRRTAVEAIGHFPLDLRVEALGRLADTHDRTILKVVALTLGEAGAPEGLIPVIRAMDECGGRTADQLRGLLPRYPQVRDLDALLALLKNGWVSVRRFSAERLRELGDTRAIGPLIESMGDEDVEVQLAAVTALGRFAERPEVAERLIAAIDYGDLTVRQTAVEALGEAKTAAAVPMLIRALGNPFLRPRAEAALRNIGDRQGYLAVRRRKLREKLFKKKKETPAEKARRAGAERPRQSSS